MIYFIEYDSGGNICHVCSDPNATIVPLINRVTFNDANGAPLKDASGNDLSSYGLVLVEPVGITLATYNTIMAGGVDNFTYDAANSTVTPKAPANAPKTA